MIMFGFCLETTFIKILYSINELMEKIQNKINNLIFLKSNSERDPKTLG